MSGGHAGRETQSRGEKRMIGFWLLGFIRFMKTLELLFFHAFWGFEPKTCLTKIPNTIPSASNGYSLKSHAFWYSLFSHVNRRSHLDVKMSLFLHYVHI